MAFEALDAITAAEAEAKKTIAAAETKARQLIADADNNGKTALTAATAKADRELTQLKKQADARAVESANRLSEELETKKAALRVKAESAIPMAAAKVVERIVNS